MSTPAESSVLEEPSSPASRPRRGRWLAVCLALAGIALIQAAWVMAVPPYRGIDEFDHAHRAAGVALGEWRLNEPAEDGRGLLTWVPIENVRAAEAQCSALTYPGPDNCFPVDQESGLARIATAAGGYHPVFYFVIGTAGLVATGEASLYAMRIGALLLCLACIGASLVALHSWHRGPWAVLGVATALTPTLLYSTSLAAPNGLEMASALAVWLALLGVRGDNETARRDTGLLVLAMIVAPLLIVPRTLGPLWFAAIGLTALVWHGLPTFVRIVRRHPVVMSGLMGVAVLSTAANVGWVLQSNGYHGEVLEEQATELGVAFRVPLWTFQMIGAFPLRDQPAPMWVYPMILLVMGALVVAALRHGKGWQRRGFVVGLILMVALPVFLNLVTLQDRGGNYQGRYALPFVVGLLPMAGVMLDRAGFAPREGARLRLLAWVMLVAAHVGSVVSVMAVELARPASRSDEGWIHLPLWMVGATVAVGWLCVLASMRRSTRAES